MFNLFRKDFIISRIYIMICLSILIILNGIITIFDPDKYQVYTYVIVYVSVMYIFSCNFIDFRYSGDSMMRSLPINKDSIVIYKYIQVFIVTLVAYIVNIILCIALKFIFNIEQINILGEIINFKYIINCFSICMILVSLYYPICFKLEIGKCRVFTQLSYIVVGVSPNFYINRRIFIEKFFINHWVEIFIISVIFFIISIKFSVILCRNRDCC